jgi:flagellar protein FlgJ
MIALDPTSLAIDPKGLGDLKRRAIEDPQGALKSVARQFESLLLEQMMRTMRTAAPGESMLDNEATRVFTGVLDQEYARQLATRGGIGLADMMVKQLTQLRGQPGQEINELADKKGMKRSPA